MSGSGAVTAASTARVTFQVTVHGIGANELAAVCVAPEGHGLDPSSAVALVQQAAAAQEGAADAYAPPTDASLAASHWATAKPLPLQRGVAFRYR